MVVAGEEFSQIWIPGRDFDLNDLVADLAGIALGDLIARRLATLVRGIGHPARPAQTEHCPQVSSATLAAGNAGGNE
jgi:hypothetical protein